MTKGVQIQAAIGVTLFFVVVALLLLTGPTFAWYEYGRDLAPARQFDQSPGCNTMDSATGDSESCITVNATITSKWLSYGRHSSTNHFSLKSDSGSNSADDVPNALFSQEQVGDAVTATVWHGAVVELRTVDGSFSTYANPNLRLGRDMSFAIVITVPAFALIVLLIGASISTARKSAERHARYLARQEAIHADADSSSVEAHVQAVGAVCATNAAPPPALGDVAGMNRSDMWK